MKFNDDNNCYWQIIFTILMVTADDPLTMIIVTDDD